jgi:hypothetical protein
MSDEKAPQTLLSAILALQRDIPGLKLAKDASNPHYKSKYITLERLMSEALPALNARGLIWTTLPVDRPGGPVLHYKLIHVETGESIEGEMPLMLDKQNPQGLGSAITYSRRQSLMAIIGLTAPGEDDDANKASESRPSRPPEPVTQAKKPEDKVMTTEELNQIMTACEAAGKDILTAAKAVGKDEPRYLTVADGWEILAKIKAKGPVAA